MNFSLHSRIVLCIFLDIHMCMCNVSVCGRGGTPEKSYWVRFKGQGVRKRKEEKRGKDGPGRGRTSMKTRICRMVWYALGRKQFDAAGAVSSVWEWQGAKLGRWA